MTIPPRRVITFKVSGQLKEKINQELTFIGLPTLLELQARVNTAPSVKQSANLSQKMN